MLQDDMDELTAWSTKWLLTCYPGKRKYRQTTGTAV